LPGHLNKPIWYQPVPTPGASRQAGQRPRKPPGAQTGLPAWLHPRGAFPPCGSGLCPLSASRLLG